MSVKELITDQSVGRDSSGWTAGRAFVVELSGNATPEQKLYTAAKTAGVPQYGDPHPVLPDVLVTDVAARPIVNTTRNQVKVTVTYAVPDPDETSEAEEDQASAGTVSLTTSLASEQTWNDVNGDFLISRWHGSLGVVVQQINQASVERPQLEVSFRQVETSIPKVKIENYLGKVNASAWSGFPSKTWLCTKIDVSQDKAGIYNVDYGFQYKPDTWRLTVVINLTQDQINDIPPDAETGNGFSVYDVYEVADFNQLGLSF